MREHSNIKVDPGKFSGIGGKVEPGESYFKAVMREMEEELGFKVNDVRPYGITQTIHPPTGAEWIHVNFMGKIPKIIEFGPTKDGEFRWVDPWTSSNLRT